MFDIIVNPATGSGRGIRTFKLAKPYFDKAGVSYRVHFSGPGHGIEKTVRDITSKRDADIIIIGGDGSMNEALNGIADFGHTRIGFIPSGSGNDLAKALNIPAINKRSSPKMIGKLISEMISGEGERQVDIGVCEAGGRKRLFNISSGMGFDAESCYFADRSRLKGILNRLGLGKLIYILTALRLIIRNEKCVCRIKTPDGRIRRYEKCLFAVAMNLRYEGGGFMFCPDADDSDGILDVCVADNISPLKFLWMFPKALSGRHVKYSEIDVFRSESLEIMMSAPCYIHTDGEAYERHRSLRLSISPDKLRSLR